MYQAPYKDKFYYWTGLHLVLKAVFFGMSAFGDTMNITISIIMLFMIGGLVGYTCPFKKRLQNFHEMILLFNLHTVFVLVLSGQNAIAINVMIALAAIHFIFIVIYHIINYTLGVAFKTRMELHIIFLFKKLTKNKLCRIKSSKDSVIITPYSSEIPEITYNYSKYQEPLVGDDYI